MEIDFSITPDGGEFNGLQPGRYFCEVTACEYVQSPHDDWGYKLTLTCTAGEHHGKTIQDRVYPSWNQDLKHTIASRLKMLVKELGMLPAGDAKLTLEPPMMLGRQIWVTVIMGDKYIAKKGKKAGQEVQYPQVEFAGYEAGDAPPDFAPLPKEDVPI